MASRRIAFLIPFVLLTIFLPYGELQGVESSPEKFGLSVPSLKIEKAERVVEFNVTIFHGLVVAAPKISYGWYMHIDLPFQWKTIVTAGRIIGVAALTSEQTSYFNDFLIIEPSDPGEYPISVNMEIKTETYNRESGITKKEYSFTTKDLRLTKVGP